MDKNCSLLTGFFPPKMSFNSTVKITTTIEMMTPIVIFGCFSAFSIRSCTFMNRVNLARLKTESTQSKEYNNISIMTHKDFELVFTQEGNVCNLVKDIKHSLLQIIPEYILMSNLDRRNVKRIKTKKVSQKKLPGNP